MMVLNNVPRRIVPRFWYLVLLPLDAAYDPWNVPLDLPARRPNPRIIRYSHERPGSARDGHAQRRYRRICEYLYPAICDDFVAACGSSAG